MITLDSKPEAKHNTDTDRRNFISKFDALGEYLEGRNKVELSLVLEALGIGLRVYEQPDEPCVHMRWVARLEPNEKYPLAHFPVLPEHTEPGVEYLKEGLPSGIGITRGDALRNLAAHFEDIEIFFAFRTRDHRSVRMPKVVTSPF